ncbi:MAG: methyltransferase domain-containing protein, partial [Planctomycetes bacterium]|nr:methyltransferase domain-containing protein [Planctomycetota bacterium]
MEDKKYRYISDGPDYRHLQHRERYKELYEEVGLIEANQQIRWREEWMKYFAPKANSTILELGAHNGPNLIHYARLGHTVHGVELSENLISTFEKFINKEPLDVQQRVKMDHGWIEEFTPENEYDYVLCTEVLEHVMNPVEILKVARKALKPHGLLYICSPITLWGNNTHVRAVPVERLRQWLTEADLSPIEIWSEDGRTFCTAQQARVEQIIGLTVVRNEEEIINETLDHLARFCTGGIYVYDDASTDKTAEICVSHPAVKEVIKGMVWDPEREMAQTRNRGKVLKLAQQFASPEDWFVYVDGDELIEFDWNKLYRYPKEVIGVRMKLYDYYITEEDKHIDFHKRKYLGPEYRKILMVYRNLDTLSFHHPCQREVFLGSSGMVVDDGYVKHYGKSVSIQQWEATCTYYINYLPRFREKWEKRRGKAVHTISDFGNKLITWREKEEKGIDLMFLVNDALNTVEIPVKQCDICGCNNSIPYKVKPAVEWDPVKKFYSDRGIRNYPF